MSIAVELSGITKSFPGVIANDDVNLVVKQGEIHAICGENGAGKSTLMKILYGMVKPDSGEITIFDNKTILNSPKDAIDSGLGMVHQHFMLADNLTVLESVILGIDKATKSEYIPYDCSCLLYTSPSPRDRTRSRMPSSA